MILDIIWGAGPQNHLKEMVDFIQTASKFKNQDSVKGENADDEQQNTQMQESSENVQSGVTLYDCLKEFEKPEQLDEDNMWYCSTCKDHVQAKKQMELFKAPLVLIINLKRFKHGKSKFSMYGVGAGKLQTHVDFPIEGLDLTSYMDRHSDGSETGEQYIYDLFGISNHFGGTGGGHYTAFALNHLENQWYSLDDSSC